MVWFLFMWSSPETKIICITLANGKIAESGYFYDKLCFIEQGIVQGTEICYTNYISSKIFVVGGKEILFRSMNTTFVGIYWTDINYNLIRYQTDWSISPIIVFMIILLLFVVYIVFPILPHKICPSCGHTTHKGVCSVITNNPTNCSSCRHEPHRGICPVKLPCPECLHIHDGRCGCYLRKQKGEKYYTTRKIPVYKKILVIKPVVKTKRTVIIGVEDSVAIEMILERDVIENETIEVTTNIIDHYDIISGSKINIFKLKNIY